MNCSQTTQCREFSKWVIRKWLISESAVPLPGNCYSERVDLFLFFWCFWSRKRETTYLPLCWRSVLSFFSNPDFRKLTAFSSFLWPLSVTGWFCLQLWSTIQRWKFWSFIFHTALNITACAKYVLYKTLHFYSLTFKSAWRSITGQLWLEHFYKGAVEKFSSDILFWLWFPSAHTKLLKLLK